MKYITRNRKTVFKKGQVLLVVIMLLATALTIALAVSFKSTTDTQVSKLDQDSQTALAAAEAGIEAAIRQGNINSSQFNSLGLGSGITGSATVDTTSVDNTFLTPLLQKDSQYSLYLTTYDKASGTFSGSYSGGNMIVYFGQQGNCPTLELTIVSAAGSYVKRHLFKPSCEISIQGASTETVSTPLASETIQGTNFGYEATVPGADLTSGNMLFIRVLSSNSSVSTPIGIKVSSGLLPLQGSTITSQASTTTGVTKKVQLFQSYPQIPAEFFVTRF